MVGQLVQNSRKSIFQQTDRSKGWSLLYQLAYHRKFILRSIIQEAFYHVNLEFD